MSAQTADVLRQAKQVLIEVGWRNGGGPVLAGLPRCAYQAIVGAADVVAPKDDLEARDLHCSLMSTMRLAIGSDEDSTPTPIWRWNDAPERTKDEVLAAFDRAIALAEAEAAA